MIWSIKGNLRNDAMKLYFAQLLLNVAWSVAFFGMHSPLLGVITIVALWTTIALTMKAFYSVSRRAATLLVPYLLWVTFAAALNVAILLLNTA